MQRQIFNSISGYPPNILLAFVIVAFGAFTFSPLILLAAGIILFGMAIASSSDESPGLRRISSFLVWFLTFALVVIVINGFFMRTGKAIIILTPSLTLWEGGILFGFRAFARLFFFSSGMLFLYRLAPPRRLAHAILRADPSSMVAQLVLLSVYYIARFPGRLSDVSDSQRARGADTSGPLSTRIRLFLPILIPIVISSLEEVIARGIILQQRGLFERSHFKTTTRPNGLTLALVLALSGLVIYGIF